MFWRCTSVFVFIVATVCATTESVTIETDNGPLRGVKRGFYYAFEGIPYGKAPVGELRFAPSELNDARWSEPRDATKPGPECLQWNHFVESEDKSIGEEDCLFMNIYTTSLKGPKTLPTIFFIHGGAFMFGSGDFYHPDNLLTRSLILVTFNYRLGPLGFLSTEDDVIPGNFGLKDQVTALKWVRSNIENFGGHKDNITLVGYSAGSASVQLHYLSSMSRGLFKNGIGHSGSVLNPWVMAENSAEKARSIADSVGCSTSCSEAMLKCLRSKPARSIVRAVAPLFNYLYNPFSPLGVVVEKQSKKNPKPFLADLPYKLMQTGQFYRVPLLLSVNEAEGIYPGAEFITKREYLNDINDNWNRLLPSILDYQTAMRNDEFRRDEISQAIRKRYLGERKLSEESFRDFIRIISNRLYYTGVITSAKLMHSYIPIYLYYGVYKSEYGLGEYLSKSLNNYGAAHGEDVLIVLKNPLRDRIQYTEEELVVASQLAKMYERFAQEGVAKFGDTEIPRIDQPDVIRFLELNYPRSVVRMETKFSDEDFWNQFDFNEGTPVASAPVKTEL